MGNKGNHVSYYDYYDNYDYKSLNGNGNSNGHVTFIPRWFQVAFIWILIIFTIQFALQCAMVGYLSVNRNELLNPAMNQLSKLEDKLETFTHDELNRFYTLFSQNYYNVYNKTASVLNDDMKQIVSFINDDIKPSIGPSVAFFLDWYAINQQIDTNTNYIKSHM